MGVSTHNTSVLLLSVYGSGTIQEHYFGLGLSLSLVQASENRCHARDVAVAAAANSKTEYQINAGVLWNSDAVTRVDGGRDVVIDCDCQEIMQKPVCQLSTL
jgi:hypothetical protein